MKLESKRGRQAVNRVDWEGSQLNRLCWHRSRKGRKANTMAERAARKAERAGWLAGWLASRQVYVM
jgi:hypothetical protein